MTSKSMWAYGLTGPQTFTEVEVPAPTSADLADGQVILRVLVGGICGSDLPYFKGMVVPYGVVPDGPGPAPTPPGSPLHEVVGEVVSTKDPTLPMGTVVVGWASQMNAMSEFIVVDGLDVSPYSPELSPVTAIMLQPLACVLYAVDALSGVAGSTAAVIGQGPIGVLFSHVLKTTGAAHVTGVDRVDRSDLGATYGVDEIVWGTSDRWAQQVVAGVLPEPDIVVEAVGHQVSTLTDATSVLRDGGQIYYFGIPDDPIYPFPMSTFLRKNARLASGFTRQAARRDVLRRADEYVAAHPEIVKPYLSGTYPFSQATAAFTDAVTPRPGRLKVTLAA